MASNVSSLSESWKNFVQEPERVAKYAKIGAIVTGVFAVLLTISFVASVVALSPVGIVLGGLAAGLLGVLAYDLFKISQAASGLEGKTNSVWSALKDATTNDKVKSLIEAYARDTILIKTVYNFVK